MSTRTLEYVINLNDGSFGRGMRNAEKQTSKLDNAFKGLQRTFIAAFSIQATSQFIKESSQISTKLESLDVQLKNFSGPGEYARNVQFLEETIDKLKTPAMEAREEFTKFYTASTNAGLSADKARKAFYAMSIAQRTSGLDGQKFGLTMTALTQMIGKGTVQAEELKGQLGEQFPVAMAIAARAYGISTEQLLKNLQEGKVKGIDFVDKFSTRLIKEFSGKVPAAMNTTRTAIDGFENSMVNLKKAVGDSLSDEITNAIDGLGGFADAMARVIRGQTPMADKIRDTQMQLNAEFTILKQGNLRLEDRKELIERINSVAGDYIGNLLTEKSTIEDITKAQTELNKKLEEKIAITARNEIMSDQIKTLGKIQKTILELKIDQAKAVEDQRVNGIGFFEKDMGKHYQKAIDAYSGSLKNAQKDYEIANKTTAEVLNKLGINPNKASESINKEGGNDGSISGIGNDGKGNGKEKPGNGTVTTGISQSVSSGVRENRNIRIEMKNLVGEITIINNQDGQGMKDIKRQVQDVLIRAVLDTESAL